MSGCEMYRILSPFAHLLAKGYQTRWAMNTQLKSVNIDEWDVIVLPRLGLVEAEKREAFFEQMRELGKTIVYEIDDDLMNIPEWNPSKMDREHVEGIVEMIRRSDLVTVSTDYLARRMREYNSNVVVLPNCVDPEFWSFPRKETRRVEGLTIGVHGGNSHTKDWEILAEVFPEIAQKYPDVKFVVAGFHPPYFDELGLGDRLIKIGWVPINEYRYVVAQIDVGLCPLTDDEFNSSKSAVKFMEHAVCSAPVVASPTVYGKVISHGNTGFLARDRSDWVRYISRLIEKPKLRKEIGAAARGYVLRYLNIHETANRWMQAYRAAWQRTRA